MKRTTCLTILVLTLTSWHVPALLANDAPLDQLVDEMQSDDMQTRARAVQLLSHRGPEAVKALIPLLTHEHDIIVESAMKTIYVISNEACSPGKGAERARITEMLFALVEPKQAEEIRIKGLQLLTRLVPVGYEVTPIASMLKEESATLREKARTALQRINTPESRAALREAVAGSDPAFQAAILHSLGEMKDREALSLACELATSEHADVRVAAADALTWTGNPIYLKTIRQVIAAADEKTRADAVDALLTLNRNIAEAGGNWEIAVRTYLQLLDDYEGQYKQAALAGLGQIGDGSCVLPIVAAIENTDTRTWLVGINALRTMPGIDVTRQLAMMIETLPRETQEKLLPVLGERGSQHAVSPLKRFSQHTDPGLQQAAIVGISRSGMPEFVDQLLDLAKSENAATRELAEKGLFKIANTLIERGDRAAAGDVYGKVLAGSDKMEVRRQALEGLAENPAPDAANHLLASADDANLKPLVVPGLVAAAKHQMEKGQCNEAINLLYRAREKDLTEQLAETLRRHLAEVGVPVKLAPMYGLIPSYYLIGPFGIDDEHERWEKQLVGEPDVDLGETHSADGQSLSWKRVNAEHLNARIDLRQQLADCNQCCAYALTTIKVAEETEATLRVSMDDSPRIWVNSQLVFDKLEGRALAVDQDIVPITLQSGENTILFKIWQDRAGWEFFVRVTTPDGLPLRFVPAGKLANDQWCAQ